MSNPLDVVPEEIPFDVPYGRSISLDPAEDVIQAAVAEAKRRNWEMNVAVTFRRPPKIFEDGVQLKHLNYLLAFDGIITSRGGIPLVEQGGIIGAIGCSGGTDSQDELLARRMRW